MPQPQPRWTTAGEVAQVDLPPGGSTGQVLAKTSDVDREVAWTSVEGTGDVVGPESATTDNLAVFADETGKLLKDGGAPGGGGSFLSANTARVDPSGNDGTGTVGDLNKPFLTVQEALEALIAAEVTSGVIDLGANDFNEDVIIADLGPNLLNLMITGNAPPANPYHYGGRGINSISLTKNIAHEPQDAGVAITVIGCTVRGAVTAAFGNGAIFTVFLERASVDYVTSSETVQVISNSQSGMVGNVSAGETGVPTNVFVSGVVPKPGGSILNAGLDGQVLMLRCKPLIMASDSADWVSGEYTSVFSADASFGDVGNYVTAFESILGDVTSTDAWFVDSRAIGTINVSNPVQYADVLLKAVPPGGTTGQALEKASNDDFDTEWASLV